MDAEQKFKLKQQKKKAKHRGHKMMLQYHKLNIL